MLFKCVKCDKIDEDQQALANSCKCDSPKILKARRVHLIGTRGEGQPAGVQGSFNLFFYCNSDIPLTQTMYTSEAGAATCPQCLKAYRDKLQEIEQSSQPEA